MAKKINCCFCGSESEIHGLHLGDRYILCCENCFEKHKREAKKVGDRFAIKLQNIEKRTKTKFDDKQIADMFLLYCEERECQKNQHFVDSFNKDISEVYFRKFFKANEARLNGEVNMYGEEFNISNKDDISEIVFTRHGHGIFESITNKRYTFLVRFNDEKVMTYKPCIVRYDFIGKGFLFGYYESAKKQLYYALNTLQKEIGSDLYIVEQEGFKEKSLGRSLWWLR